MNRKAYSSDLADKEWTLLEPFIPPARPGVRPRSLGVVRCLVEEWPCRFIELSLKNKVWSSLWLRHLEPPARAQTLTTPFWLWAVVHDHLYRARYYPSNEEIDAAIRYLKRNSTVINKSALARLLGIAVVRRKGIDL